MIPIDVKSNTYIVFDVNIMRKTLHFKLIIMLDYQNMKAFSETSALRIRLKRFLRSRKVENTVP